MKFTIALFLLTSAVCSAESWAATHTRSESTAENSAPERHFLLDPVELTPVTGFTVVDGTAGFNLGAHGAYPLLSTAPLYLEPSIVLGFFSKTTTYRSFQSQSLRR